MLAIYVSVHVAPICGALSPMGIAPIKVLHCFQTESLVFNYFDLLVEQNTFVTRSDKKDSKVSFFFILSY